MCCRIQCLISCDPHINVPSYFHLWFTKYFFSSKVYRCSSYLHSPPKCLHRSSTKVQLCLKDPGRRKSVLKAEQNSSSDIGCLHLELFPSWILFISVNILFFYLKLIFMQVYIACTSYFAHTFPFSTSPLSLNLFAHFHLYFDVTYKW